MQFAPSHLDRCESERRDDAWIEARWSAAGTLLVCVDEAGRVSCAADERAVADLHPSGDYDSQRHFLLGRWRGVAVFGTPAEVEPAAGLRTLLPVLDEAGRELVLAAVALVNWHRTSPHCGACGALTRVTAGGIVRHCDNCNRDRFPRSDPAIIVAVLDPDDRLLLGHQVVWPTGRMSILAGFVSAGESLEEAVRREVAEETGVRVGAVRYLSSQPWPFPRSLMLGFVARALSEELIVDGVEIEHARWFSRDELDAAVDAGEVGLPGSGSIAQGIIGAWRHGTLVAPEG